MAAKKKSKEEFEIKGWRIKHLSDAFLPRPPREYFVDGLFPFSTLNMVFGVEGSMKSLLMMDMAICGSEGLPWLPYEDNTKCKFGTKKCNVLYVDCDNGSLTDDERINAFAISHGLASDEKSSFTYISMPEDFDVSETTTLNNLIVTVIALNVKVLVLDNLGLINSVDENSPGMAKVMSNLRKLANRGLCVIVVHHQRKSNGAPNGTRLGETLRGHSSIAAALDYSYFISRKDANDNNIIVSPTKCRFAPVQPFGAKFHFSWIEGTSELQSASFTSHEILSEIDKGIGVIPILVASEGEITQTKLVEQIMQQCSIGQRAAKQAVTKCVEERLIHSRKGAHNSTILFYDDVKVDKPVLEKVAKMSRIK